MSSVLLPKPATLIPKPTASQQAQQETIALLRELLAAAEAGDIVEIFAVMKHPDASWSSERSTCADMPSLVGRLEMAKQGAIANYLANQ